MKEKILLLMMLCALSSLCHAQKIQFEYDEAGNITKRYVPDKQLGMSVGNGYSLRITIPNNGKKANVKFVKGSISSSNIVDCHIEATIRPVSSSTIPPYKITSEKGDFDVSISWMKKNEFYTIDVIAYPDKNKSAIRKTLKFQMIW